jgi:hypothetical protein
MLKWDSVSVRKESDNDFLVSALSLEGDTNNETDCMHG